LDEAFVMPEDTVRVRAPEPPRNSKSLDLTSTSIQEGATIDLTYVFTGCGGQNVSPQLAWRGAPQGTKSFAITCFDPDAPTGSGYWHWLVFNIPSSSTSLEEGVGSKGSPAGGSTGYNDFGQSRYCGPCPPKGDTPHRYIFTVYALDIASIEGAGDGTTGATLVFLMRGHVLATGSLTARFGLR
jgi:Raf kinase inhibitor-like YbhB/YbcL family protein